MPSSKTRDRPPLSDIPEGPNLSGMTSNVDVFASLLYPSCCALCGRPFHMPRPADLCAPCRARLRTPLEICRRCAQPCSGAVCSFCQERPPPFGRTWAVCLYTPGLPGHDALRRWKIGGEIELGEALGRALARTIAPQIGPIDAIAAIPGRRIPAARRGFDTAHLIAEILCRELGKTPPLCGQFIRRQAIWHWGAPAARRRARGTIRGALYRRGATPIRPGSRFLLVDDLMTTQASARACSELLLSGGAGQIDIAVVGRTSAPEHADVSRE